MSGNHGHSHKPFEGHMHDFEAHIKAVEEDLEYYRAKRFEPRIFYLLRRNVVTFSDLLKARVDAQTQKSIFQAKKTRGKKHRSPRALSGRVARRIRERHRAGFSARRRGDGHGHRGQPQRAR